MNNGRRDRAVKEGNKCEERICDTIMITIPKMMTLTEKEFTFCPWLQWRTW